ncbi:hypothetical protein ACTXT7_012247 [Hymenolepis weldensis]
MFELDNLAVIDEVFYGCKLRQKSIIIQRETVINWIGEIWISNLFKKSISCVLEHRTQLNVMLTREISCLEPSVQRLLKNNDERHWQIDHHKPHK